MAKDDQTPIEWRIGGRHMSDDIHDYQVWCEPCGVRMKPSKDRTDIIKKVTRKTLQCPMCKKWEWDPNDN